MEICVVSCNKNLITSETNLLIESQTLDFFYLNYQLTFFGKYSKSIVMYDKTPQ